MARTPRKLKPIIERLSEMDVYDYRNSEKDRDYRQFWAQHDADEKGREVRLVGPGDELIFRAVPEAKK